MSGLRRLTTGFGVYYPSDLTKLRPALAQLMPGAKFCDLGSGFGAVVKLALAMGLDAWGMEANLALLEHSAVRERILQQDITVADLSEYDAVYYYYEGCGDEQILLHRLRETYQGVIILGCFEHTPDDVAAKLAFFDRPVLYHEGEVVILGSPP